MSKKLTISIIIPVYNEEDHIQECLEAIASQTEPFDEVIVVDNNSTDRSAVIAKRFPFVRIVHEKQQGIVYARNAGFNAAKSNYIARIDADVIIPLNWAATVRAYYADGKHESYGLTGGGRPNNLRLPRLNGFALSQIAFRLNRLLLGHYILFGSNSAFPRQLWQEVKEDICLRTDIHEDIDLAMHADRRGYQITYRAGFMVVGRADHVVKNREKLLSTLLMWPKTLRTHGKWTWVFGWAGAYILYFLSPVEILFDKTARLLGRPPLDY